MKTVAEVWDLIRDRSSGAITVDRQVEVDATITAALWELFNTAHDGADLRAHVGDLEEERNQARENEAVALRDLNDIDKRLDSAIERAQAFEAALFVVLQDRAAGADENTRRIGELLLELNDVKAREAQLVRATFERTVERCAAVTRERALGANPLDVLRNVEARIRALAYEP